MRYKRLKLVLLIVLMLYLVIGFFYGNLLLEHVETIHIALVGPMSELDSSIGKSMQRGAQLYLKTAIQKWGINGRKIILDVYDDQNNEKLAQTMALEIADTNKAIAVVGHHRSGCSIAAGRIYRQYKIPAITPGSTNVKITRFNPWYYRTVFNDNLQGQFLADYAGKVLKKEKVIIVYSNDDYGAYLATVFEASAIRLGMTILYQGELSDTDVQKTEQYDLITNDIQKIIQEKDPEGNALIFLSMAAQQGIRMVKTLKDRGCRHMILGPDSFSSHAFDQGFNHLSKEKEMPGFYTEGIYVSTHIIYDTANQKAQAFREKYFEYYGEEPDWIAAYTYDTMMLICNTIQQTGVTCQPDTLNQDRQQLQQTLSSMDSPRDAIEGVTGYMYFDEYGDAVKPISIGFYKQQKLISALVQLQTSGRGDSCDIGPGMFLDDNKSLIQTNVVYVGIKVHRICNLDLDANTYSMDFSLWFRSRGEIDVDEIDFINAVKPVQLDNPVVEKIRQDIFYRVYRINGQFKGDFLSGRSAFNRRVIGVSLHHKRLSRDKLIFVADVLGMGLTKGESLLEKLDRSNILDDLYGWSIDRCWLYQDAIKKDTLGDPDYLMASKSSVAFSVFNLGIRIMKNNISMRGTITSEFGKYMLVISTIFLLLVIIVEYRKKILLNATLLWFFHVIVSFIFFISLEAVLADHLIERVNTYHYRQFKTFFDMLWWVIPAFFINSAFKRFIWYPIEEKTGRKIPNIVCRFVSFVIYMMTLLGIIAFVFDQRITSLLATSGVIAMIIGLAIQINISNIFSGIAINLERPFQIGDWVKISDLKEGQVIDITWRTTRLKTRDDCIVSIPNSTTSESIIHNYHYPDDIYRLWFTVHIDPGHSPERVRKILMDAVLSSDCVLKTPEPKTRFIGLTDWAADYLISFSTRDYGEKIHSTETVWSRVWTHLYRAGIMPAIQRQEVHMFKGVKERGKDATCPEAILNEISIFSLFPKEVKIHLSKQMKSHCYSSGQSIVQQGDEGDSLFIIVEGVVGVWVRLENEKTIEVDRMGAGTFFGEMALLTGEPRTASIIATTDTMVYEITKAHIAPLIEEQPEISKHLSEALTQRTIHRETQKGKHLKSQSDDNYKEALYKQMLSRIKSFFGIG